jgi:hypothetical protein
MDPSASQLLLLLLLKRGRPQDDVLWVLWVKIQCFSGFGMIPLLMIDGAFRQTDRHFPLGGSDCSAKW